MISILIPIYNYNIENLILRLEAQLSKIDIKYEIICCDDCSTEHYNYKFDNEGQVSFLRNSSNLGRTETRQKLAKKAQFEWLLFLDADVLPSNDLFIKNYLDVLRNENFELCFGGFSYELNPPTIDYILRWKYGHAKESIRANQRELEPYKTIISANILVKKGVFLKINANFLGNYYGYDNLFSIQLKKHKVAVLHIDNPVLHLGLETGALYLRKKELAAETIFRAYNTNKINESDNKLLKTYLLLKRLSLTLIVSFIFKKVKNKLRHNLLGANPNIFLLNSYRLGYFCSLKNQSCNAD